MPNLTYLSGAPRVSTRIEAESAGPRAHVLGVIHAFEQLGWSVNRYIVGDKVPLEWVKAGSEKKLSQSAWRRYAADVMRVFMSAYHARKAYQAYGAQTEMVYERFGAFQNLGGYFKRRGKVWVLETNAPLFAEAVGDRRSIAMPWLAKWLETRAYKECDVLVVVSDELKKLIVSHCGIPAQKVVVLPNGVDTVHHPALAWPSSKKQPFTIGFMGSLYGWQRLDILIDTLAAWRKAKGPDVRLRIIGAGEKLAEWQAHAQKIGMADRVEFTGRVAPTQVGALLKDCHMGYSGQVPLSTGSMYLSPLKLYEYMAFARPVLASAFADAASTVTDGKTGYLFKAADKASLRKALEKAYATHGKGQLQVMGKQARQCIVAAHSWTHRVRLLLTTLDNKLGH